MDIVINNLSLLGIPHSDHIERRRNIHIGIKDGKIAYIGKDLPHGKININGVGSIGLPGLVDPHTHAIWGGSRAHEFSRRLSGTSYSQILEEGGGILSTVEKTREKDFFALHFHAQKRLHAMQKQGVTHFEIKSGYGLSPAAEHKLLSVANKLGQRYHVVPTFLGAHTIPREYRSNRSKYVEEIIKKQLPLCAPLAQCIDVYCDRGAFTLDESIAILKAGKKHGLKIKAHAEQNTHTGIARAAAELGAISVEHLEYAQENDIAAMKENGTVAVLLPGAQLYLKDRSPPVQALREAGVPMAIGTDLNPGSSPVFQLMTCATLACILQGVTIEEAILGITIHAGKAIGDPHAGKIQIDGPANLALFTPPPGDPVRLESLVQSMGYPSCQMTIQSGKIVHPEFA
ncbi:MAG: imidazolonepropionase [Deltaproteobacteria bacterium]|nr:imidazolonepropionase [Deltaproteobacteria bacterium]